MRNCYKCCHTNGRKRIKNDGDTTIDGCLPGKEIQPFFIVYFIGCLPICMKLVTYEIIQAQCQPDTSIGLDGNIKDPMHDLILATIFTPHRQDAGKVIVGIFLFGLTP